VVTCLKAVSLLTAALFRVCIGLLIGVTAGFLLAPLVLRAAVYYVNSTPVATSCCPAGWRVPGGAAAPPPSLLPQDTFRDLRQRLGDPLSLAQALDQIDALLAGRAAP
jgi:hypothetical protein